MKAPTDLLRWISLFAFASVAGCISPTTGGDTDSGSSGSSTTSTPTTTGGPSTAGMTSSGGSSASRGSSEVTTAGGLPPGSGCCDAHAGPGCDEAAVQECVCDESAPCCGFDWSQECVDLAQGSCAATCEADGTTTGDTAGPTSDDTGPTDGDSSSSGFGPPGSTGGFDVGPCCDAVGGGTGCLHQPTRECVCAVNSSCCEDAWTAECAALAESDCNACTSGDCCAPQNTAGCGDETVEECVCNLDDFCCNEMFDEICADLAASDCNACQAER